MKKGVLIAIIGIDGAGKTTQSELLSKWLKDQGNVVYDIPNIPSFADCVFDTIAKKKGYNDAMELFPPTVIDFAVAIDKVKSYSIYTEKIAEHGAIIISQRYSYCKIASAIRAGVQQLDLLTEIYKWIPKPDLIFYMDLPIDIALKRIIKRGIDEETYSDLYNFKNSYESLEEYKDFVIIDASKSVEEIQDSLRKHIKEYLDNINWRIMVNS